MPTALELAEATPPGMAHYAGTGPAGTSCASCQFFLGRLRAVGIGQGTLQPGRCRKFMMIMRRHHGLRTVPVLNIPPETPSCRHYGPKI